MSFPVTLTLDLATLLALAVECDKCDANGDFKSSDLAGVWCICHSFAMKITFPGSLWSKKNTHTHQVNTNPTHSPQPQAEPLQLISESIKKEKKKKTLLLSATALELFVTVQLFYQELSNIYLYIYRCLISCVCLNAWGLRTVLWMLKAVNRFLVLRYNLRTIKLTILKCVIQIFFSIFIKYCK